ncbi:sodium- and chloride-dependent transporter XTRP3A [Hydra vulgaris]|uniref:sodium- and chloride-dependent transporter XTRP3A n=1 Tax=Hydra vulgaris TaxID=6087 RepID=UPI00019271D2|nr:sodium- and chloride-dependent transporter XTRP3A isoform X1 [Hydra vulgaris]
MNQYYEKEIADSLLQSCFLPSLPTSITLVDKSHDEEDFNDNRITMDHLDNYEMPHNETKCTFKYADVNTTTNFNRDKWNRRTTFLMMLMGYTIGLGNVWRFPYLCHKNGGATFLIPYFFLLFVEGLPLYYMELCIGQRLRRGSVAAWHLISPYLDGLGIASIIICVFVCLYYNVIVSWCLFYFTSSFKDPLPWSQCPTEIVQQKNMTVSFTSTECLKAGSILYFWYRTTLNIAEGIETSSETNWTLALYLLLSWFICWICMINGIHSEGKVVYITATLPLVLLAAMFFRGVNLKGFQDGLALLFLPDFTRLKDHRVWLDAASQVFYSLGIAYGSLIAFASYNPLKNDTTRDSLMMCVIDASVSIYSSIVLFCFLGYRAHYKMEECLSKLGTTLRLQTNMSEEKTSTNRYIFENISNVLCNKSHFLNERSQSTGLAFIAVTEVLSTLPNSRTWCILFFLMLVMLGVDTQFGMLEGVVTPILDSKLLYRTKHRTKIITGLVCFVMFVLSFSMVQNTGNYWLQLFENYCSGVPLMTVALLECFAVSYVYGIEKFSSDILYMTNKKPRQMWIFCWKFLSPCIIVIVLVFSIYDYSCNAATYQVWNKLQGKIESALLPPWSIFLSLMLLLFSIMFIPLIALIRFLDYKLRKKKGF